jgi:predicted ATPase
MINEIHIRGFKSLVDETFPLGGVTLLCGMNNSGKSSVIQAIRMYCNSAEGKDPLLAGHGSIDELRSKLVPIGAPIEISCKFDDKVVDRLTLHSSNYSAPKQHPVMLFLSAERFGPRPALPLDEGFRRVPSLGDHGEYVIGFLDALRGTTVPEKLRHPSSQGTTLDFQVAAWLTEIAPGAELYFEVDRKVDSGRTQFNSFRAPNAGFGLSYSLPIIVAVLGAATEVPSEKWDTPWDEYWDLARRSRGTLLLIENPEAHLHPSAQTALGRLISLGAAAGLQIVVETQSDHLMDGVRLAVKQKLISASDVVFNYLSRSAEGKTDRTTPVLDEKGKLSSWPNGFFDQTLKNRIQLAKDA